MSIQDYIDNKKEIQNIFIDYIDCEDQNEQIYSKLKAILDLHKIFKSREETLIFLHMIIEIANHHHRTKSLFIRIEKILSSYKNEIIQIFSNNELFQLFKINKLILLFLFKENMITLNDEIITDLKEKQDHQYFYPEIQEYYNENIEEEEEEEYENKENDKFYVDNYGSIITNFDEFSKKREKGENDSYICEIIRKDSIHEFVFYINQANIKHSEKIKPSIFETNLLLQTNTPTLIEYAAFFGSIKIYKYLRFKAVNLNPELFVYAVHSRNVKMIHLLENDEMIPKQESYEAALNETFKCFHDEISKYIIDNLFDQRDRESFSYFSLYYNFNIILDDVNRFMCFCYFCAINNFKMVKHLLQNQNLDIDLNKEIILKFDYLTKSYKL